ncbi:MAG: Lead, cadmium, zinc and mercury transporting ATPase; Copper-translocating P-type ATPase [uncultured Nocardioidaceae bacterium]|uniref:Lead, cadmium, zinc and mercury transporting ATPase Copper-translocating P-type ATPase n=1 Tax=uncultured Nocardioidaceae bacterium TaxID=253824 RepID=A0A6J4M529_9ACTN|nr:MAG: Lead, cadmium, zinc and mercury transporting ATPase; Copper-translocating P-type ATPase [uncultured Nocardioidaceae bacterium]
MKRRLCAATLVLEAIMLALTTPVLIAIADVSTTVAVSGGVGLGVLAVVAAGSLRSPVGYLLGHLVQVGALALGLLLATMVVLGLVFTALWVASYLLGRRIDLDRAAA